MKNFLWIGLLFLAACSPKINTSTYWVNSYKVQCDGVGKRACLQVQKADQISDTAWQNFSAPIKGFDYQPGYLYQIKVTETQLDAAQIPADASSIAYELVEVMEKINDPKLRLNDIWILTSIGDKVVEPAKEGDGRTDVQLGIHLTERSIIGTDGCNRFRGSIHTVGSQNLEFGPIAGTRRMCMNMEIADAFNKSINQVRSYTIENRQLTLFDENHVALMTFIKTD